MKEINLTEVGHFNIGNAQDFENGTGVTVIISKDGMGAGIDIRGGGPASRETPLLNPLMPVSYTHLTLPTTPVACRSRWSPYH